MAGIAPSITEPLGYDTTYTWSGSAVGDGKAVPWWRASSPLCVKTINAGFQLADGDRDRGAGDTA